MIPRPRPLLRILSIATLAGAALLFGGCASPSQSANMVAVPEVTVTKHAESVFVQVTGGSDTSSMGASKISNADFAEAIKASITQSGLFAKLAAMDQADYQIEASIVRLDQPIFGASFTVNIETNWRLVHRSDSKVVWQKAVVTSYTATMGDAMVGVTRLRLANEGAARKNIQEAIAQMSALTLP